MHLVYVDESGDIGLTNSPTREYLLVAIIVPEERWHDVLTRINRARRRMKDKLGLDFAAEIHAAEFLGGAHSHLGLIAWQRVRAIRWLLKELSREPLLRFVAIGVQKQTAGSILRPAWARLVAETEARTAEKNHAADGRNRPKSSPPCRAHPRRRRGAERPGPVRKAD
jgi:hypothetical protein